MRIYGEFLTIAQIPECFGLLINDGSVALVFCTFENFGSHSRRKAFAWDGCSKLGFCVGVALKLLDQLFLISACGSCVFP